MSILDRLFKGKSHSEIIDDIVNNLRLLAESELEISEFYKLCGEKVEEDKGFWETLVKAEVRHADMIRKMIELIQESPKDYAPGQAFNPATIRTFKMQIDALVHDLQSGKTPVDNLFSIANGIENSAMEIEFTKIVETQNSEFQTLARQIDADCRAHKGSIEKRATGSSE